MTSTRTRATPMSAEARRRAIVEAVVPLVLEHGQELTTKQIADAAGIAEGTIFRVFPDKRALLLATAEATVDPAIWTAELAEELAGVPDLVGKIALAVDKLAERMTRVLAVTMALRSIPSPQEAPRCDVHGLPEPPVFVLEANHRLVQALARLVFEPHIAELAVPADRAALILRSLVLGALHPGGAAPYRLTTGELAQACARAVGAGGPRGGAA